MYSLRRTLAVRFSLTMLLTLLLIGLWAFLGSRWTLSRELDRGLRAALSLESAVLASGRQLLFLDRPAPDSFVAEINRFVAVRDADGNIVSVNTPAAETLPLDRDGFERARSGERAWVSERWGDRSARSVYGPVPDAASDAASVIQVTASLEPMERASFVMFLVMLATVAIATAATGLGAGWMATQAVTPVAEITAQADAVDPHSGPGPITAHADVEEFESLVGVLNTMLDRLHGSLEAQRRIIADVGHELRTPLSAMHGTLEVALRSTRTPDDYHSVLGSCHEEVEHLMAISESLILLARIEAQEIRPDLAPTNLAALAEQALERLGSRAGGRAFVIDVRTSESEHVDADAQLIALVMEHLLSNAVQHTPSDTSVRLAVETDQAHAAITVDDSGPGIPDEALSMLFERFYRSDASRTRVAGAGLGLTISAAIIAAHGGTIEAARSPLGGLRVACRWPVTSGA